MRGDATMIAVRLLLLSGMLTGMALAVLIASLH